MSWDGAKSGNKSMLRLPFVGVAGDGLPGFAGSNVGEHSSIKEA